MSTGTNIWPEHLRKLSAVGPAGLTTDDRAALSSFAANNPQGAHDAVVQYRILDFDNGSLPVSVAVYRRYDEATWEAMEPEDNPGTPLIHKWHDLPVLMVRDYMTHMFAAILENPTPSTADDIRTAPDWSVAVVHESEAQDELALIRRGNGWHDVRGHASFTPDELIAATFTTSLIATPSASPTLTPQQRRSHRMTTTSFNGTEIWPEELKSVSVDGLVGHPGISDDVREKLAEFSRANERPDIDVIVTYLVDIGVESDIYRRIEDRWIELDTEDGADNSYLPTWPELAIHMVRDGRSNMVALRLKDAVTATDAQLDAAPRGSLATIVDRPDGAESATILWKYHGSEWIDLNIGIESSYTTSTLLHSFSEVKLLWTAPEEEDADPDETTSLETNLAAVTILSAQRTVAAATTIAVGQVWRHRTTGQLVTITQARTDVPSFTLFKLEPQAAGPISEAQIRGAAHIIRVFELAPDERPELHEPTESASPELPVIDREDTTTADAHSVSKTDPVQRLLAEAAEFVDPGMINDYRPFDRDEKLGEEPWSREAIAVWEDAHKHDVRLKCYPEFGCVVTETYAYSLVQRLSDELAVTLTRLSVLETVAAPPK